MSVRKGFSKKLFDENDGAAKNAARDLVVSLGVHALIENTNKTGVDLIGVDKKGNEALFLEVEIKHGWKGHDFPFSDINLPERKGRYLNRQKYNKPVIFAIFNDDLTRAALFGRDAVIKAKLVEVSNKYVRKGEMFFKISLKDVRFVDIGGDYVRNRLKD